MIKLPTIKRIIDIEYARIVVSSEIFHGKLRACIIDGSFVDICSKTLQPS